MCMYVCVCVWIYFMYYFYSVIFFPTSPVVGLNPTCLTTRQISHSFIVYWVPTAPNDPHPKHHPNGPLGMMQKECTVAMVFNSAIRCWLGTWHRTCCTLPPLPYYALFQAVHIVLIFPESGLMVKFQSREFDLEIFWNIWKFLWVSISLFPVILTCQEVIRKFKSGLKKSKGDFFCLSLKN